MRRLFAAPLLLLAGGCSLLFSSEQKIIGGDDGVVLGPGAIEFGGGELILGVDRGSTIDTTPDADNDVPLVIVRQRNGADLAGIVAGAIRVDGPVRVTGSRGLVFVAAVVILNHVVDGSAVGGEPGPGGLAAGRGGNSGTNGNDGRGGGGGGASQAGAVGSGDIAGGAAVDPALVVETRAFAGGAGGGNGEFAFCGGPEPEDPVRCNSLGGGGGGLLVVVAGDIQINAGAGFHVGGGGGVASTLVDADVFCDLTRAAGSGGGAGGTIALFADGGIVNAGTVAANGGGGSDGRYEDESGIPLGGQHGQDGGFGIAAAPGVGGCGAAGLCGGSGGARGAPPGDAGDNMDANCRRRRGGGGGGAGFIFVEAPEFVEGTMSPEPIRINAP